MRDEPLRVERRTRRRRRACRSGRTLRAAAGSGLRPRRRSSRPARDAPRRSRTPPSCPSCVVTLLIELKTRYASENSRRPASSSCRRSRPGSRRSSSAARATMSGEKSIPATRTPRAASGTAILPVPIASSSAPPPRERREEVDDGLDRHAGRRLRRTAPRPRLRTSPSSRPLQLPGLLRVPLADAEDRQPDRRREDGDDQERPDVRPGEPVPWRIDARQPRSTYVAGEIFESHCIHSGMTLTG